MSNPFQKVITAISNKLSKDTSKMLIWTGAIGWILSSAAQIGAIAMNPKIKEEQKGYLIPQEMFDAMANIGTFLLITCSVKSITSKLFSTGKFAPKEVRAFLNKNKVLKNKVGKLDLNLDEFAKKNMKDFPKDKYYDFKNGWTTVATLCSGILASNIITPIIRNKMASRAQKNYIMISEELKVPQPNVQTIQKLPANYYGSSKGNMKI